MIRLVFPALLVSGGCSGPGEDTSASEPTDPEPTAPIDADGDGLAEDEDCDDADPALGGSEVVYDGIDNDCDPLTFDDDLDGDGLLLADDCDDTTATLGGVERFGDDIDNDCDGLVDCHDPDLADIVGPPADELVGADLATFCDGWSCREVLGNVLVSNSPRADLGPLSCLTAVGGSLQVNDNPLLGSLDGLEQLERAGELLLLGNPSLVDLTALENLTRIDRSLVVQENRSLRSLQGLSRITEIPERLVFGRNRNLESLDGLDGLTALGDLELVESGALTSIAALGGVTAFEGDRITITGTGLESLIGLEGLTTSPLFLEIYENDALASLAGLDNIVSIETMHLVDNDALVSLDALANFSNAPGALFVSCNDALESLDGLEGLREIGANLEIGPSHDPYRFDGNASLVDVTALYGIESVGYNVVIQGNSLLGDAAAQALVDEIETIGGTATVSDN